MSMSMVVKGEDALQVAVADYIRLQYPHVLFTHIANERKAVPQYHLKLKRMGLRPGMPDIMIFDHSSDGAYTGLAIELKYGKNKITKNQENVLLRLQSIGWYVCVRRTFDSVRATLDCYLR